MHAVEWTQVGRGLVYAERMEKLDENRSLINFTEYRPAYFQKGIPDCWAVDKQVSVDWTVGAESRSGAMVGERHEHVWYVGQPARLRENSFV